jgi:LysR family transcriptional regulator, glycine cleavage system transcriptional activator
MNSADSGIGRREIPFASLVAFEATARLGSVSRAASELNLTQSAVSQRVLKLEAHAPYRRRYCGAACVVWLR